MLDLNATNGWGTLSYGYNPYVTSLSNRAYIWVGGFPATSDGISLTIANAALSGGQYTLSYSVASGAAGSTSQVAAALAAAITSNATLSAAGISAASSDSMVAISAAGAVTASAAGSGGTTATTGGGGKLAQITNNVIPNSPISYSYDSLNRVTNRMINGASNNSAWSYDEISRITAESNPLGSFSFAYIDNTSGSSKGVSRLQSVTYPNGQTSNFTWLPNLCDQRLQQIKNLTSTSSLLSQFNYAYNKAGEITQWKQQQNGTTIHQTLGYDLDSELLSAPNDSGSLVTAYISGTAHAGDTVSLTAYEASLTGTTPVGQETASYLVQSGDTASDIANGLASAIGTTMSNIGTTAVPAGSTIAISTTSSYAAQLSCAVTGTGATTTIALSQESPVQPLHKQLYYKYDCAANRTGVQGDSSGSFPTGLTTSATQFTFNNVHELKTASAGGPIAFKANTVNPVKSAVVNPSELVTISGSAITPGDILTIGIHDKSLSQAENLRYVVQAGDTTTSIATQFASQINADAVLSSIGVTATSSGSVVTITSTSPNRTRYMQGVSPGATESIGLSGGMSALATASSSQAFAASPTLAVPGASSTTVTAAVTAVSGGGTSSTAYFPITISAGSSQTFQYDANGNMTSDGANTYSWDAENRLVQINYPGIGNNSQLQYDSAGRCVQIVETTASSVTSTKQFLWCGTERCEVRDGSGSLLNQYLGLGQINVSGASSSHFYDLNHRGDIVEQTDSTGAIESQFTYSPYGEPTEIAGAGATPAFGYAGMDQHQRSGLNLTMFRAFSPQQGRWLSRDPLGEGSDSTLYSYSGNDPVNNIDPLGLKFMKTGNPAYDAQIDRSIDKIDAVPGLKNLVKKLRTSPVPIYFHQSCPGDNPLGATDSNTHRGTASIRWNPTVSAHIGASFVAPPEELMLHEFGHVEDLLNHGLDYGLDSNPVQGNPETRPVNYEDQYRKYYSLPGNRPDYSTPAYPYNGNTPIQPGTGSWSKGYQP